MFGTAGKYLRQASWPIIAAMIALMAIGIAAIGVSHRITGTGAQTATTQIIYSLIGLGVFATAAVVPYPRIGRAGYVLFALSLAMLVAVMFTTPIKGARRWFNLQFVNVQPSEIAKLTYIIALGWYLRYGDHYRRLWGLLVASVMAFVPMGLILLQPDLGTGLLFLPTLYFMLFMAGAKLRHLLLTIAIGLTVVLLPVPVHVDTKAFELVKDEFVVTQLGPLSFLNVDDSLPWRERPTVPLAYCRIRIGDGGIWDIQPLSLRVLKTHQQDRISGWLRHADPRVAAREGFQLRWSLVTLGAGGWKGPPETNGNGSKDTFAIALHQLPHERTDFIFSLIGGKWGFVGCLGVLGLYAVIFVFGIEIATLTYDPFARLLVVGVLALLLSEVFINIGMTLGMMPITGMTLPLVSYGGSSLVVNCAALGLLVNVGMRRAILLSPHPFEHGEKRDRRAGIESVRQINGK